MFAVALAVLLVLSLSCAAAPPAVAPPAQDPMSSAPATTSAAAPPSAPALPKNACVAAGGTCRFGACPGGMHADKQYEPACLGGGTCPPGAPCAHYACCVP